MKHIRTKSVPPLGVGRRVVGAVLVAVALVLVSPALSAGAQTEDTVPGGPTSTTPGDSVPDDSVPEDSVPDDSVPEDSVPDDSVPEDSVPEDTVPEDEVPEAEVVAENITVVQTPDEEQDDECTDNRAEALRNFHGGDDESWHIRIEVDKPLCTPIEATAAIYGMPGNGEAWPQNLVETFDFTLQESGTTVVTFSKAAECAQYDVLTGDTPPVIAPLGEWHGPLLFPFDVSTSYQNWDGCPEVAAVTTLPPPPAVDNVEVAPAELALTGSSSTPVAVSGAALLLAGAMLLLVYRRRTVA